MKVLIVEDDPTCRTLLGRILDQYGDCDAAENGSQALDAIEAAWKVGQPYDLVCLDIMLPKMNGQAVLEELRRREAERGLGGGQGVSVCMTTSLSDAKNVMHAFRSQCEGYLVKPIDKDKVLSLLGELGLVPRPQG
jgi:two-component system, chemotaxis family, chemotaxis protein CheY